MTGMIDSDRYIPDSAPKTEPLENSLHQILPPPLEKNCEIMQIV